jgi:hypothetical protein
MATVSDITTTPTSGLNHIDALLDTGPDWNYLTRTGNTANTLFYTFSTLSGNEAGKTGQEAFTLAQQVATRGAFDYITKLTGIQFTEVTNGDDAQIHLCNFNIPQYNVTGLCSWHSSYTYQGSTVVSYDADAYVYLDNVEWSYDNHNLMPGRDGYETLLHELGHALGLKHPFFDPDSDEPNQITLPSSQDNTSNTLMSYTPSGGPYSTYSQYDIAALKWLYGGDGLAGALGINSTNGARYIAGTSGADTLTGTAANDTLEGDGGNDMINGGSGTDTAVFRGVLSNYAFTPLANGDLLVASKDGTDGTDTLHSIETLQFSGGVSVSRADVVSAATTTPAATSLTLEVSTNANGYSKGNTPLVSGQGDVGATIKIFSAADNHQVGTATVNQYGMYSVTLGAFADGVNQIYATETNAAGSVVLTSATVSFKVDITPPVVPTYNVSYQPGNNQAVLSGTAEAGSTIELVRTGTDVQTIAHTTVGADGKWQLQTSPLPNGGYNVIVASVDNGGNGSNALSHPAWTVNSAANISGTGGKDVLQPFAGNNAVDGGDGIDTAVYAGSRAAFTVKQADWGFDVTDNAGGNGHDALINVERVQFDDGFLALDVDGSAGQVFRLYSAAFGRPTDAVGLGFWIANMDNGVTVNQVARAFMTNQVEFDQKYGVNPSNETFVMNLYHNVLGRDPDAEGYQFWMNALNNDANPDKLALRSQLLIDFSNGPENVAKVVGSLEHGLEYTPYHTT